MLELTTDSHPTGNSRSARSMRGSGKRSPLDVRSTTCTEGIAEGAADQVVDAESSLLMTTTRARGMMHPQNNYWLVWLGFTLTMSLLSTRHQATTTDAAGSASQSSAMSQSET